MRITHLAVAVAIAAVPSVASADTFEPGSLIVPMDTEMQDEGMFRAYGLVYALLREGVPVRWVIRADKQHGEEDFTTSATDLATGAPLAPHGYRGGPWVVDAGDVAEATPIVDAWMATYPETTVHEADEEFEVDVARYLVAAPTLAMLADGNEDIAREYMLAAGIPDSSLDLDWPDESPDLLTIEELMGPTQESHADGSLFDEDGDPVYCQLMSMHWGIGDAEDNPEVVAETRQFLNNPTHFFAECQAVNAFENLDPHGFFLTPNGFEIDDRPDEVEFIDAASPFGQIDGEWVTVGGSEPSYSLPEGDMYKAGDIVMVTAAGTPEGVQDVWMTGYLDGECPPDALECGRFGKVSYLGGHRYEPQVPISENFDAQGARMFLNSLFEAPCGTVEGLPTLAVAVDAPDETTDPEITLKLTYVNTSFATALDAVLIDPLPEGVSFVSASGGGELQGDEVVWDLGNLGPSESGDVEIVVTLPEFGTYENTGRLEYRVGLSPFMLGANTSTTVYADSFPSGSTGSADSSSGGMSGSDSNSGSEGGDSASGSGGTTAGTAGTGGASETAGAGSDDGGDGCGCTQSGTGGSGWALFGLGLLFARRRRRWAAVVVATVAGCSGSGPGESDDSASGLDTFGVTGGTDSVGATTDDIKLDIGSGNGDTSTGDAEQVGCEAIDFLFVIDSSESMKTHQENLVASFPGFADEIASAVPENDWHVMVVDTDAQWGGAECANACQTLGSCPDAPEFDCEAEAPALCDISVGAGEVGPVGEGASNEGCLDGSDRFIEAGAAGLGDTFACLAQVGVDGNSQERQAEAMVRAISPDLQEEDGCNEGFLRDDAILVVTVITDEADEHSPDDPAAWWNALVAAKADDAAAVVVLGLLPDGGVACEQEDVSPRLDAFVGMAEKGLSASVCEPDYSPFFAQAVDLITATCDDFVPPIPAG